MSSAYIEKINPSLGFKQDQTGGNTFQGRLELAQGIFARILKERFGDRHVNIMDVGIGDGAVTIIHDLPKTLITAGIKSAMIIGVDVVQSRVYTAQVFYEKAKQRGAIPEGINMHFERGDIYVKSGPLQLSAVAEKIKREGVISGVDLITSFNLLTDSTQNLSALEEMAKVLDKKGVGFLGSGETERHNPSSMSFTVFNHPELGKRAPVKLDLEFQKSLSKLCRSGQDKQLDKIATRINQAL